MKTTIISMLVSLVLTVNLAAELSKTMPLTEYPLLTGNEKIPDGISYPYNQGLITESPGIEVGYTYSEYQSNGSGGNRIALFENGSKWLCWTCLTGWPYPPAPRHVFNAWISANNDTIISIQLTIDNSRWPNLDINPNDFGAIVYNVNYGLTELQIFGDSQLYNPPGGISPKITIDRNNNIHILSYNGNNNYPIGLLYTHSTDSGSTWSLSQTIDDVMTQSAVIDASPVSDRVVIAYTKSINNITQWKNDVVYNISEDGLTWDFQNGNINITNYNNDEDSLWAYTDVDVIIDYHDYFHIIWNAQWVSDEGIYHRTFLYHYSEETDDINLISAHPDSLWMNICGAWNRPICKMNLGVQEVSNALFAIWTQFDTSDVSAGGFGNGELFMSYTLNGSNWNSPTNITNSSSPDCYPGDCDSDHWATLADKVNQSLHITYINDKDAGSIMHQEGAPTDNPVMYFEIAVDTTGIVDDVKKPESIVLYQNYPNPFNAATNIKFDLPRQAYVTAKVFDITGALVAALLSGVEPAGHHTLVWDASEFSSGVYFINLKVDKKNFTRKMVLLK